MITDVYLPLKLAWCSKAARDSPYVNSTGINAAI